MTFPQRLLNFARRVVRKARQVARRIVDGTTVPAAPSNAGMGVLSEPAAALAEVREQIRQLRGEMTTQISFLAHDLAHQGHARPGDGEEDSPSAIGQRLQALEDKLHHLDSSLHSRLNTVETLAYESKNQLIHLDGGMNSRLSTVETLVYESKNQLINLDGGMNSRLNALEFVHLPALVEQLHEVAMLNLDLGKPPVGETRPTERPRPQERPAFDDVLERARRDFPVVFDLWKERLDATSRDFDITKTGNAANPADLYSRLFKLFVDAHARGAVLDVGCGPFGKPYYLSEYPAGLVSGLEPLPSRVDEGDIDIVRGISEYLLWANNSFDTVISATSLDHCLALDRSLDEMRRVLKADGAMLLWVGHIPGSPEYRPLAADFQPADRFHLFHFDVTWFEPLLERQFSIESRVKLDRTGYSHVFYCLRPLH